MQEHLRHNQLELHTLPTIENPIGILAKDTPHYITNMMLQIAHGSQHTSNTSQHQHDQLRSLKTL
eukprot:1504298-Amphidinium_carterae.1